VVTVADHQPPALLVDLVLVGVNMGGDLSLQRRREHPPGPLTDQLVQQRHRRRRRHGRPGRFGGAVVDGVRSYGEHGRGFPTDAPTSA
jgi:hypothetical protein